MATLALTLAPAIAGANRLPAHSPWPGGIAVLNLGAGEAEPRVALSGNRVLVLRQDGHWVALVGVPLGAKAGRVSLEVNGRPASFLIDPKDYDESRIQITDPTYTEPPDEQLLQRIAGERQLLRQARATWQNRLPDLGFLLPAQGQVSTPYGFRRYINGELRSSHRGLDIAAPVGTPITAPAAGRVVLAQDLFFTGLTAVLDHGMGVQTLYAHMSALTVKPGDEVDAGAHIGDIGATGRVTGPHLHWGLTLNGISVDPALLLSPQTQQDLGLLPPQ